jgi:multidrug efflux system outer membrane protein
MMYKEYFGFPKKTFLNFCKGSIMAALLIITGCRVGPNYKQPEIKVPEKFDSNLPNVETGVSADLSKWWTNLDDPELNSLVNDVFHGNFDIKIAGDRIAQAQAIRGVVSGSDKPQVNLQGTSMREDYSLNSLFGPFLPNQIENDIIGSFGARWEIDLFGKTARSVEAAQAGIEAAVDNRNAVMVAVSAGVAKQYILLRQLQNQLDVTNHNIEIQQNTIEVVQQRFEAGLVNELVLQQAKAQLEATKSVLPKLDTAMHQAVHRIGILTGQEPKALENQLITKGDIPATKPMIPLGLPSDLLTRRPDVRRAERNLAAATANIGAATADLFPRFSLTGSAGLESTQYNTFFNSDSKYWTLAYGFSWPILDAGIIRSNIKLQNARQKEVMDVYTRTVLSALEDVENALVAYGNEQKRMNFLEAETSASQRSVDLAKERFEQGLVDFLNVLDAERQLYQAEDALTVSKSLLAFNLVTLYESLGGGWELPHTENK